MPEILTMPSVHTVYTQTELNTALDVQEFIDTAPNYKCHLCPVCNGRGCIGQMPGMGGPMASKNFKHNIDDWKIIPAGNIRNCTPDIRVAPITGAIQNIGYAEEKAFYFDMVRFCTKNGIKLSLGDGTPDFKLLYGIQAVTNEQNFNSNTKAAVFIKPYANEKIMERAQWAESVSEVVGIDIDAYNIITMRNLVNLEKKTAANLKELKAHFNAKGIPFAIKGIFTQNDIELVKAVKPDIAYISNHGGRVETREGSTAEFLAKYSQTLRNNSDRLWIDGGIRHTEDIEKAASYGVDTVLLGRPVISSLCSPGRSVLTPSD